MARVAPSPAGIAVRAVGLALCALLAGPGCRTIRITPAPPVTSADWVTEGDAPERHGSAAGRLTPPLEEAWVYNAHAGFGTASPLIWQRVVFVATRKGEVHAIDRMTGKKRGTKAFGDAIEGSPVLHDHVLYVPSAWGGRAVTAYDVRTGTTRWRIDGPPVEAGLLVVGGRLIVADVAGAVRAFDAASGQGLWERTPGDGRSGIFATPLAVEDHVLVADDRGHAVLLEAATGAVRWTHRLPAPVYRTPVTDGRRIFVPTTRGRFVALDARDGRPLWTHTEPDTTVRFTAPAYRDGAVFVGTSDGRLLRLAATTGEVRWEAPAGESLVATPLPAEDVVYVGGMDRRLYALDTRTGERVWTVELEGRVKSPMAARDGFLVVLAEPRFVYAFKTASTYAVVDP